jgi:tetratricopeptide (TPR) repeat protein
MGRNSEAQQYFNKSVVLNPESPAAHFNLAATCLKKKLRECALEQFDILKTISPDLSGELCSNLFSGPVVDARNKEQRLKQ